MFRRLASVPVLPALAAALALAALPAAGRGAPVAKPPASARAAAPAPPPAPAYGPAAAGLPAPFTAAEFSIGSAGAPVTVVEYLSAACPHCAHFDADAFPQIKSRYIDTGKVRWVVRELLAGEPSFAAAGFVLARCTGRDKYWTTLQAVFRAQDKVFKTGDIRAGLLDAAHAAGLNEAQFDACVAQDAAYKATEARSEGAAAAGVHSTPVFFLNGRRYDSGAMSFAEFEAALRAK